MRFEDNIADDEWEWYIGQIIARLIQNTHKSSIKDVVEIFANIMGIYEEKNVCLIRDGSCVVEFIGLWLIKQ